VLAINQWAQLAICAQSTFQKVQLGTHHAQAVVSVFPPMELLVRQLVLVLQVTTATQVYARHAR
jgi:hypothetical protein